MDHKPGSTRPIFYDTEDYPRFVGDRGVDAYLPKNNPGAKPSVPIGEIPQVAHTFAYFEGTYAIINEHQVGIGESTCSAIFGASSRGHGGKALFSVDSLSRIALERATTAREAVQLMGSLAEAEGFYGAGTFEGTGESLMVVDPLEGFIFHILPDDTGASAIWAAQRVPDEHVGVVANMFTIREIDPSQATAGAPDFLFSASVHAVARRHGWWTEAEGLLDFTKVYSDGEYAHKFYSGRRMWGAYLLMAPKLALPSNYSDLRTARVYPTTATTTRRLSPLDLAAVHRSMYEGTPFDMHVGAAAGAFGSPDRYATAGATAVPAPYVEADPNRLSRTSLYWAHKYAINVARARYSEMIQPVVAAQQAFEAAAWARVRAHNASRVPSGAELAAAAAADARAVLAAWWALPDAMIFRFADGWLDNGKPMGYPEAWLNRVGWAEGPPPPPKDPHLPHCCQSSYRAAAPLAAAPIEA